MRTRNCQKINNQQTKEKPLQYQNQKVSSYQTLIQPPTPTSATHLLSNLSVKWKNAANSVI